MLITNGHSLTYYPNYHFAFFFKTQIKAAIQVLRQYASLLVAYLIREESHIFFNLYTDRVAIIEK